MWKCSWCRVHWRAGLHHRVEPLDLSALDAHCRIALTGDAKPHFTTIADFVSRSHDAIASVFAQVLSILGKEGLSGREMFAIDGVELSSLTSPTIRLLSRSALAQQHPFVTIEQRLQCIDLGVLIGEDRGTSDSSQRIPARRRRLGFMIFLQEKST